MVLEDVMLTFNRKTRTFKFYTDNREAIFTGDYSIYKAFKLFSEAMNSPEVEEKGGTQDE